jgi:hypothetical protein
MNRRPPVINVVVLTAVLLTSIIAVTTGFAQIPLSTSTPVTQNFNGIGTSATATLPDYWRASKDTANVRTVGSYSAAGIVTERAGGDSMISTASTGIYNFGDHTDANERSVGFLDGSSLKSVNLFAMFRNGTGTPLSSLTISYDVEKYRNGKNSSGTTPGPGFYVQLYYSTDGTTWTSAGSNFLNSFPGDADTNGFNPAPGLTVSVTNQTLTPTIPFANGMVGVRV